MDRALSPAVLQRLRVKRFTQAVAGFALLIVALLVLRAIITPTVARDRIRTAVADLGTVEATISASGTVVPEYEQSFASPIQTTVDSIFLGHGDSVATGQAILRLDLESINSEYQRLQNELDLQRNRKDKLTLDLERSRNDFQAQYDVKALQTQFIESQLKRVEHLHTLGGETGEGLERARLNVDIAKRELEQLGSQIKNQEAALAADLRELDLRIRIQENELENLRRRIEQAEIRADRPGVITFVNETIGATVSPGDVVARLADLGSYKIEAKVSEIHAAALSVGAPARIRVTDLDLTGLVTSVRPTVENGVATFVVTLDDKGNSGLRPSLRAEVFVVTTARDRVVRVKNGPFHNGSRAQDIFVVRGDQAVRHRCDIGLANLDFVELIGDIQAGDTIVISDMSDYEHMAEVDITND